jgi:TolA-binding protein
MLPGKVAGPNREPVQKPAKATRMRCGIAPLRPAPSLTSPRVAELLIAALLVVSQGGCISQRGDGSGGWSSLNPFKSPEPPPSVSTDTSLKNSDVENAGSLFGSMSWDGVKKDLKKMTGRGENHELAARLYREGDDLFRQALAVEPVRRPGIFEMAGPKYMAAVDRWPDSQLAMDALFMAGESYYFADCYAQANLCYEKLVKAFPQNRYLDQVDRRRFTIARYWLDVNHQSPEPFWYANWTNKTRPWRDIDGHALRIYDKIRVDDPTGKLADDATLAAANEFFASGKFWKADEYYTDLRKAYPTSEHQFTAHFIGVKAKLLSYQGPMYGGTGLDETEKLIKQTRRQFPTEALKERDYLDRASAEVRFRKAEQIMYLGQFYDRREEYRAAEHYYARLVRDFHDTPLAQRAEERVSQIAGLPPKPAQQLPWLVALFPESDKVKPLLKASQKAEEEAAAETQLAAQPPDTVQR